MNTTYCQPRHNKGRFAKRTFLRRALFAAAALLPGLMGVSGCRHSSVAPPATGAHAGDANQQALRQSRDILSRRSATLRAKRAQSASKIPAK